MVPSLPQQKGKRCAAAFTRETLQIQPVMQHGVVIGCGDFRSVWINPIAIVDGHSSGFGDYVS